MKYNGIIKCFYCIVFITLIPIAYAQNTSSSNSIMSYSDFLKKTHGEIYVSEADKLIERIEKIVAENNNLHLSIAYKNRSTGEMLLKGYYDYQYGPLLCIVYNFQKCRFNYSISIKKDTDDLFYNWTIDKLNISFSTTYSYGATIRSLPTSTLEKIHNELRIISSNSSSFDFDSNFFAHLTELNNKIVDNINLSNDMTLKKKERKMADYYVEKYTIEKEFYDGIVDNLDFFIRTPFWSAFR